MASTLPQTTLLGWTMSEKQKASLLDGPDGSPGLFKRAGFATPEAAAERYGRMEGFKLVSVMIGICNELEEKALCESKAGSPVSVDDQDGLGGQLGYLIRLQVAAKANGLDLADRMLTSVVEKVMLDEEGTDWVLAHRTLDKAIAFFGASGVDVPPRPERKDKASTADSSSDEPMDYPSK